jgi:hypothetical protein
MKIEGRFTSTLTEEGALDGEAPKMTRAALANVYEGSLVGTGRLEYLFMHGQKQVLSMGLERITGTIDGKQGSFVLDHEGISKDASGVQAKVHILPESGTGDFKNVTGQGEITANFGDRSGTYSLIVYFG